MSSLHYLRDYDLIILLGDYVLKAYLRKKKQDLEDARQFHEKNFQECIDVNRDNRYLLSHGFDVLKENYVGNPPYSYSGDIGLNLVYRPSSWTYWFGFSTKYKICFFENSLKIYEDNTKLQRC